MNPGYSTGQIVSYKQSLFGKWRDATVVEIDTSEIYPFILEDEQSGQRFAATEADLA